MAEKTAARVEAEEAAKPQPPRPAAPDQRLIYTRLANDVRQSVAMYACIESGLVPLLPRDRPSCPSPAPAPRAPLPAPRAEPRHPHAPPPPKPTPAQPEAAPLNDTRRPGIARYILEGIENTHGPETAETVRPDIEARIAAELAADPEGKKPGTEIFTKICNDIGLPLYYADIGPDLKIPPKHAAIFARRQSTGPPGIQHR